MMKSYNVDVFIPPNKQSVDTDEWLGRDSTVRVFGFDGRIKAIDLSFEFRIGPVDLYKNFPFLFQVYSDPGIGEIVEVTRGATVYKVQISDVPVTAGSAIVRVQSECGGIPADLGLGKDVRELAVLLLSVKAYESKKMEGKSPPPARPLPAPWEMSQTKELEAPIFIIGTYRSGTSITTWVLGQHPNIAPLDETGWLSNVLMGARASYRLANRKKNSFSAEYDYPESEFIKEIGREINALLHNLANRRARRALRQRLAGTASNFSFNLQLDRSTWSPKRRWVDGTPEQTLSAIELADAFPEAKFLFMVRNPISVAKSLAYFENAGGEPMSVAESAAHWLKFIAAGTGLFQALGPDRVKIVIFEHLLADPEDHIRKIFSFLGELYFSPASRGFKTKINSSNIEGVPFESSSSVFEPLLEIYKILADGGVPCVENLSGEAAASPEEIRQGVINEIIRAIS